MTVTMITVEKVKVFASWDGDIDMFTRAGRKWEKDLVSDDDWALIERILQDQIVIKRNLVSPERVVKAVERFKQVCENDEVVEMIGKLAEKFMKPKKRSFLL
ncbi:MAG: hypothetical protein ABI999_10700 [Acidobacteriota bacterium]